MAKVSVIIPTYNCSEYLKEAIDSVFRQSFEDIEILIIDDGSTDETGIVIQDLIIRYPKKLKYYFQNNQGVSVARNRGIELAQGDYLAFLDADDLWLPNFLNRMLAKISEGYDWVVCDNVRQDIDVSTGIISERIEKRKLNDSWDSDQMLKEFLVCDRIGSPNKILVKREIVKKHNIKFDPRLRSREDWDFCLQLLERKCRLGHVHEPLSVYRIRNDRSNTTRKLGAKWLNYTEQLLKKHRNTYISYGLRELLAYQYYNLARLYYYEKKDIFRCGTCLLEVIRYRGFQNIFNTFKNKLSLIT